MTQQELDALKARRSAVLAPAPWNIDGHALRARDNTNIGMLLTTKLPADAAFIAAAPADIDTLLAEVERLRAELADVLEIAIARGDSLGYESMDYCARLEQLRPDSEILAV